MSHDGQTELGSRLENLQQRAIFVNKHVARARPHEELDARNALAVELGESVNIVVCGPKEEAIVHMAALPSPFEFVVKRLERGCLRNGVRHIEKAGHTSECSSTALAFYISLFGQSRLTEMHMRVDDSRQNETPRSIDSFIAIATGRY